MEGATISGTFRLVLSFISSIVIIEQPTSSGADRYKRIGLKKETANNHFIMAAKRRFCSAVLLTPICLFLTLGLTLSAEEVLQIPQSSRVTGRDLQDLELQVITNYLEQAGNPTEAPTESPAPSPSPSRTPTIGPTVTPEPTATPTESPTESPAPSPSPSRQPTLQPTDEPTKSPTMEPTISHQPSMQPSSSPSMHPTTTPSQSPTERPSNSPSSSPTAAPTSVIDVAGSFTVWFDLQELLSVEQASNFELGTEDWIIGGEPISGGSLLEPVVTLKSQRLVSKDSVEKQGPNATVFPAASALITGASIDSGKKFLELSFDVKTTYSGSDNDFDLFEALNPAFQEPDFIWVQMLGNRDPVFLLLRPETIAPQKQPSDEEVHTGIRSWKKGVSSSGYSVVVIAIVGSIVLGLVAMIYTFFYYQKSGQGHDPYLYGFNKNCDTSSYSQDSASHHSIDDSGRNNPTNLTPSSRPASPSTIERGGGNKKRRMSAYSNNRDSMIVNIDVNGNSFEDQHNNAPVGRKYKYNEPANTQYFDHNSHPQQVGYEVGYQSGREDSTQGASSIADGKCFENTSEFSNPNVFSNKMGKDTVLSDGRNKATGGTLGACETSYETMGAELYDVFAPAGPIGIIVDTTKDGPVVHSLKATSPMLGLIGPGDLIVGLDDEDTRSMTAATLTRLMAKKCSQKERKITLLTADTAY